MNNKDNKYIFDDDENDDLEIAEYLERELDDMAVRENRQRPKRAASVAKKQALIPLRLKKRRRLRSRNLFYIMKKIN